MSDTPSGDQPAPRQQPQIRVVVSDDLKHGEYANFAVVQHTAHEFTLDFCQTMPSGEPGKVNAEVVARIKIAPTMVGQVMRSLANAQSKYEGKFGSIKALG